MSITTKKIVALVEMLPESEQLLAYEVIKRFVLANGSSIDFLEPDELEVLANTASEAEFVSHDAIN